MLNALLWRPFNLASGMLSWTPLSLSFQEFSTFVRQIFHMKRTSTGEIWTLFFVFIFLSGQVWNCLLCVLNSVSFRVEVLPARGSIHCWFTHFQPQPQGIIRIFWVWTEGRVWTRKRMQNRMCCFCLFFLRFSGCILRANSQKKRILFNIHDVLCYLFFLFSYYFSVCSCIYKWNIKGVSSVVRYFFFSIFSFFNTPFSVPFSCFILSPLIWDEQRASSIIFQGEESFIFFTARRNSRRKVSENV